MIGVAPRPLLAWAYWRATCAKLTRERWVTQERSDASNDLLQAGIAAMKARQLSRARSLLMRAVAENENDARAWLCLSRVLRNPAAQKACLEKALLAYPGRSTR